MEIVFEIKDLSISIPFIFFKYLILKELFRYTIKCPSFDKIEMHKAEKKNLNWDDLKALQMFLISYEMLDLYFRTMHKNDNDAINKNTLSYQYIHIFIVRVRWILLTFF